MRVTTFGLTSQYLNDLNNVMQKYQIDEQQLSTGNKINEPSDDPVAFSADIQTQTMINQATEWDNNAKSATTAMNVAQGAISQLEQNLSDVRAQLVEANNSGTMTSSDTAQMATVVKNAISSVAQIANTNDGSQYIFAGTNGTSSPLTGSISSGFTWNGNNNSQNTYIGKGIALQVNTDVSSVFNNNASSNQNLMRNLVNIYNDLNSNNTAPISATNTHNLESDLSDLDSNIANVTQVQSDIGGRITRAQSADSQLSQMINTLTTQQSQLQDADVAKVITDLTQQQTVYNAALKAGQQMILPTLADVLN